MLNIAIVLPEKLFLKKSLPDIYSTNSTEFLFKYNYNLALVLLWLVRKWHFSKNLHKRGRNRFEHLLNCKQGINRQNYYILLGLKASIFFFFCFSLPLLLPLCRTLFTVHSLGLLKQFFILRGCHSWRTFLFLFWNRILCVQLKKQWQSSSIGAKM